jgi:ABC-type lipoprotein release transport system permease subunit
MAHGTGLQAGDVFTLQWRDRYGTFDAREARVVAVFRTQVQSVDRGQLWLPLQMLQEMTEIPGEATLVTVAAGLGTLDENGWVHHSLDSLLADIRNLVRSKMLGSMFIYAILLFLAMLAIFDTRVFAIFKRQREIGTLVALGMTRGQVARLFTLEGILNAVLALALAGLYGWPLLGWFTTTGWRLPETTDSYGYALGDVLYPIFSGDVILETALIILILAAVVSFLPTRRITSVAPTDALRGRVY